MCQPGFREGGRHSEMEHNYLLSEMGKYCRTEINAWKADVMLGCARFYGENSI